MFTYIYIYTHTYTYLYRDILHGYVEDGTEQFEASRFEPEGWLNAKKMRLQIVPFLALWGGHVWANKAEIIKAIGTNLRVPRNPASEFVVLTAAMYAADALGFRARREALVTLHAFMVCVCVCVDTYIYVYVYDVYIHILMCVCISVYICTTGGTQVPPVLHIYSSHSHGVSVCVCMYVYIYVSMCVCIYIYVCIYVSM